MNSGKRSFRIPACRYLSGCRSIRTVSKIATGEAKPNGELMVPQDTVRTFLSPLSIRKIPGIGEKTFPLLRSMGVSTIETLSMIPKDMMERVMGRNGAILWERGQRDRFNPCPALFGKQIRKHRNDVRAGYHRYCQDERDPGKDGGKACVRAP